MNRGYHNVIHGQPKKRKKKKKKRSATKAETSIKFDLSTFDEFELRVQHAEKGYDYDTEKKLCLKDGLYYKFENDEYTLVEDPMVYLLSMDFKFSQSSKMFWNQFTKTYYSPKLKAYYKNKQWSRWCKEKEGFVTVPSEEIGEIAPFEEENIQVEAGEKDQDMTAASYLESMTTEETKLEHKQTESGLDRCWDFLRGKCFRDNCPWYHGESGKGGGIGGGSLEMPSLMCLSGHSIALVDELRAIISAKHGFSLCTDWSNAASLVKRNNSDSGTLDVLCDRCCSIDGPSETSDVSFPVGFVEKETGLVFFRFAATQLPQDQNITENQTRLSDWSDLWKHDFAMDTIPGSIVKDAVGGSVAGLTSPAMMKNKWGEKLRRFWSLCRTSGMTFDQVERQARLLLTKEIVAVSRKMANEPDEKIRNRVTMFQSIYACFKDAQLGLRGVAQ